MGSSRRIQIQKATSMGGLALLSLLVLGCGIQVFEPSGGNQNQNTGGAGGGGNTTPPDLLFKYSGSFSQVSHVGGTEQAKAWVDATGTSAKFYAPSAIASDGTNLYVADVYGSAYLAIRKIVIATGTVTTLTDSISNSGLTWDNGGTPYPINIGGMATDGTNIYFTNTTYSAGPMNLLQQMPIADPTDVTTLAGQANTFAEVTGVTGTNATFAGLGPLAIYGSNLYVSDSNVNATQYDSTNTDGWGVCSVLRVSLASGTLGLVTPVFQGSCWDYAGYGAPGGDTTNLAAVTQNYGGVVATGSTADPTLYILQNYYNNSPNSGAPMVSQITNAVSAPTLNYMSTLTTNLDAYDYETYGMSLFSDGTNLYAGTQGYESAYVLEAQLTSPYAVSALASNGGYSYVNGPAADVFFGDGGLQGVALGGSLYIADADNGAVRVVSISNGYTNTFAGSLPSYPSVTSVFSDPSSVVVVNGTTYIADTAHERIEQVTATGTVSTLAGTGSCSYSGTFDGTGTAAYFCGPSGMATDGTNLYVTDGYYGLIRKIVISSGVVTTIAGSYMNSGLWQDGTGTNAYFNSPRGIAISPDNSTLYVADTENDVIRKVVISTGAVTTIAGGGGTCVAGESGTCSIGSTDGSGTSALFYAPGSMTTDGSNLYITDGNAIRKLSLGTLTLSTLAGSVEASGGFADGTGGAAAFYQPAGITISSDKSKLYITDYNNNLVRQLVIATGAVTTVDHSGETSEGTVVSDSGGFYEPYGIFYSSGELYVVSYDQTLRVLNFSTQEITTVAGTEEGYGIPLDGTSVDATFRGGGQMTTDGTNIYISDGNLIREISIATGSVTTLAGALDNVSGFRDGVSMYAAFNSPTGITTDGTNLYVVDSTNHAIRKVVISSGTVTTLLTLDFTTAGGIATDGYHLYFALGNQIYQAGMDGSSMQIFTGSYGAGFQDGSQFSAAFSSTIGSIATDGTNLYVVDAGNFAIRKVSLSSGAVTTLAGGAEGYVNATGTSAEFESSMGQISTDGVNVYVIDSGNYAVRQVTISGGVVTSLIYSPHGEYSGQGDGPLATSSIVDPTGLVSTTEGLFMVDNVYSYGSYSNAVLRQIH